LEQGVVDGSTVPVFAACLKDLQRLLRQDESETREAFQVLGRYNIAKSDLVPMIVTFPKETDIVYSARTHFAERVPNFGIGRLDTPIPMQAFALLQSRS